MVCLSVEAVLAKTLITSDNQVLIAAFDATLNKQSAGSVTPSESLLATQTRGSTILSNVDHSDPHSLFRQTSDQ